MKPKKENYKILEQKKVFRGGIFDVVKSRIKTPMHTVEWAHIEGPQIVAGVVLTNRKTVLLKKEFRVAHKGISLELPAGKANAKNEKRRISELNRELQEEVGVRGRKIEKLADVFVEAHSSKKFHLYLVRDLKKSKLPDEDEPIEVVELPFDTALKTILSGKYPTTLATVAGLLLAKAKLKL